MMTPSLYVSASIIGFTLLGLISKLSEKKAKSSLGLVCALCLVAALILSISHVFHPALVPLTRRLLLLGIGAGITASTAFICLTYAIRNGNFGFSVAFANASFLLPVLFSAFFWNQPLGLTGICGILLVLAGLLAISWSGNTANGPSSGFKPVWLAAAWGSMLLNGLCQICQASSARLPAGENDTALFLWIMYASGALAVLPFALWKKELGAPAIAVGSLSALSSLTGTFCMIQSLRWLPPSMTFPACLCGPILLSVLISALFFREPVRWKGATGIGLGLVGLFLLSRV